MLIINGSVMTIVKIGKNKSPQPPLVHIRVSLTSH